MPQEIPTLNTLEAQAQAEESSTPAEETQSEASSASTAPVTAETIVAAVFDKAAASQPATQEEEGQSSGEKEEATAESEQKESTTATEEEELPPFHEHPRWKEVQGELKVLREKQQAFDKLTEFRTQYGVSEEQMEAALQVVALGNTKPEQALEALKVYTERLEEQVGAKLPNDLQQEVEDGLISEARAKELARLRATAQGEAQRAKQAQQTVEKQFHSAVAESVGVWEQTKVKSDPTFKPGSGLYQLVLDRGAGLWRNAPPKTPQEAVKLFEDAYQSVKKAVQGLVPPPPARKVLTSTGSSTNVKQAPPKTPQEAVERALAKHRK